MTVPFANPNFDGNHGSLCRAPARHPPKDESITGPACTVHKVDRLTGWLADWQTGLGGQWAGSGLDSGHCGAWTGQNFDSPLSSAGMSWPSLPHCFFRHGWACSAGQMPMKPWLMPGDGRGLHVDSGRAPSQCAGRSVLDQLSLSESLTLAVSSRVTLSVWPVWPGRRLFIAGPPRDVHRDGRSDVRTTASGQCSLSSSRSHPLRFLRKPADRDSTSIEQVSVFVALHPKVKLSTAGNLDCC